MSEVTCKGPKRLYIFVDEDDWTYTEVVQRYLVKFGAKRPNLKTEVYATIEKLIQEKRVLEPRYSSLYSDGRPGCIVIRSKWAEECAKALHESNLHNIQASFLFVLSRSKAMSREFQMAIVLYTERYHAEHQQAVSPFRLVLVQATEPYQMTEDEVQRLTPNLFNGANTGDQAAHDLLKAMVNQPPTKVKWDGKKGTLYKAMLKSCPETHSFVPSLKKCAGCWPWPCKCGPTV